MSEQQLLTLPMWRVDHIEPLARDVGATRANDPIHRVRFPGGRAAGVVAGRSPELGRLHDSWDKRSWQDSTPENLSQVVDEHSHLLRCMAWLCIKGVDWLLHGFVVWQQMHQTVFRNVLCNQKIPWQ
ncbi:hypothetical protein X737_35875 [Mesorhizobium sp. L48C026A00]|nr:hypothetical protein X737_35875 [Mesorhizobium sp. L48C026A00]